MANDAEGTLRSTNITKDERKDFSKVFKKLDEFFKVRKNVIFERAKFNRRYQVKDNRETQYLWLE